MKELTVAIVSHRTPELAEACAESIQTGDLRADIVIAETGAQQPATPIPPDRRVSHFFMPGLGYSAALHRVLAASTTPYLIACNADVEFPDASIEPLIEQFEDHSRLALIGPRQVSPAGRIVHAGIPKAGDISGGRGFGEDNWGQYRETLLPIRQVSGSVMVMRARAFREVGGMARMPHLYYEDALLCHRLWHAGWEVAYSGLLTFTHRVAASPSTGGQRAEMAAAGRAQWERETGRS